MIGAVDVLCPNCQHEFLVPDGAAETLCPSCDEHIVWRQCLSTRSIFPVLSRWKTWEHPGCPSIHAVDLTQRIPAPGPASPSRRVP